MKVRALLTESVAGSKMSRVTDIPAEMLGEGNVLVSVEWSTVNFKDGSALVREGRVMTRTPMIGGIDLAGVVADSGDPRFAPGDRVLVNGYGLSMTHHGGYASFARVPGSWLVPVPDTFSTRDAMAIGTAGLAAMLAVLAIERHGISPESGGVLVTGATGGLGSIAVAVLAGLGYTVTASTGRPEHSAYLRSLGAAEIIDRAELSGEGSPLADERWVGAIDSVGSRTLANVLGQITYGGVVAACGLAQGNDLPASVSPFLARRLTLVGIDSVQASHAARVEAWARLADVIVPDVLDSTVSQVSLGDVPRVAIEILAGRVLGRTVVDVNA